MNISDLKDGCIVKLRNGEYGYVNLEEKTIVLDGGFLELEKYNDDLTRKRMNGISEHYDIMEIYIKEEIFLYSFSDVLRDYCKEFCRELSIRKEMDNIDWTKVPKFTPVQVRDSQEHEWKNAYFGRVTFSDFYGTNIFFVFGMKDDEFTGIKQRDHEALCYRYCRIYDDVEIKEEWYK